MFKPSNFCHIASNNRNEVKAGVFVYKTTDDLQTVLGRGYFNKKIIDLNLHDLIIHVQENNADKTVVQKNTLCVVGKTLDDVITDVIKSDWQESIEDAITELQHTDTNLQTQITANKNAIDKEITDRTDADSELQEQITKNAGDITTLQNNINTVSGNLSTHINDKNNPHAVTKAQVGLGNVDNTSDADKPVSDATQTELNKKENTSNKVTTITSSSTNVQYPSAKAAKDYADKAAGLAGNPVGSIISYAGTTPPEGYLACTGASLSRTTYAALFAVIGTAYTNALYAWTLASADPATVFTASETPAVGDSVYLADGTESTTITAVATGTITTSVGTYARAAASDNTTTFNLPDFQGARFVNSADIKNPTVYVGKVGDGNTRMGMHAGEGAGNMDRLGYIIAPNYSGNPAYLRGLVSASRTVDNDTNQYLLAENQLSVAPEMLVCVKY